MDRRKALHRLAALSLLASGCTSPAQRPPTPGPLCPVGQGPTADGPLVIDIHCHVVNGSDLQTEEFLSKVVAYEKHLDPAVAELLGRMASLISWSIASQARDESALLSRSAATPGSFAAQSASVRSELVEVAQKQKEKAQREIDRIAGEDPVSRRILQDYRRRLLRQSDTTCAPSPSASTACLLRGGLVDPDAIFSPDIAKALGLPGMEELRAFLVSMLQYRYQNCREIAEAYSCAHGTVDLYCPALLDFDYWLGGGKHTLSPLPDQYIAMEHVMRLMGGTFHAYVPFNPWSHIRERDYFATIKDAVETRGFIGVKLYPPMGFAPYGNASTTGRDVPPSWRREDAPTPMQLDAAMAELYTWCDQKGIPLLTHAGPSFGPDMPSDALGSPDNWGLALDYMQRAKTSQRPQPANVCFGHTGGAYLPEDHKLDWAQKFADKAYDYSDAYGDLSYWAEFLLPGTARYANAKEVIQKMRKKWPGIDDRLMYGSDWNLLLQEKDASFYEQRFIEALRDFGVNDDAIRKIMGENAVAYLGLRIVPGVETNGSRLNSKYTAWQVAPVWLQKVARI